MENGTLDNEPLYTSPGWIRNLFTFIGVVGFTSNLLVCVVLLQRCMRKSYSRHYFISLAVGDMLYSVAAVVGEMQNRIPTTKSMCQFYQIIGYGGYYGATHSMIVLAIERLCAIKYPLFFRRLTKKRNIRIQIISVWVISLMLTIYPTQLVQVQSVRLKGNVSIEYCGNDDEDKSTVYDLLFSLIVPVLLVLSFSSFAIHALKKRATTVTASGGATVGRSMKKPWIHLTFILVMFCMCFLPYFAFNIFAIIYKGTFSHVFIYILFELSQLLTFVHTWLNPAMHWSCDTEFQNATKRMFCGRCTKPQLGVSVVKTDTTS